MREPAPQPEPVTHADPLAIAATPERIRALFAAEGLRRSAAERALELATEAPSSEWVTLLRRGLLLVGAVLLLAGVIFFFAYNWASLGRFEKLGVIAAGIVAAALAGWQQGDRPVSVISLFAASVLVGALLAVYGQAYQTGADPYELFTAWLLLILPWAAAARRALLFALAVVLLDVAISLWWAQVYAPGWSISRHADLQLLLFIVDVIALVLYELWSRAANRRERWFSRTLATLCLLVVAEPALDAVAFDGESSLEWVALAAVIASVVASTALLSRGRRQDLFIVASSWLVAVVLFDAAFAIHAFDGNSWWHDGGPFLLLSLLVIGEIAGMVALLRKLAELGPGEDAV